jgi:hypothetical protein
MGYFSNGSEGEGYEAQYCVRCIHGSDPGKGCPVWFAHLHANYYQVNNDQLRLVLAMLIPMDDEGIDALKCNMFIAIDVEGQERLF